MANLKEIRTRITSVKSTRQITSAMKLVSAAKLRKAQNKVTQLRPYADKLHFIIGQIVPSLAEDKSFKLIQSRPIEKVLVVIITSNRGLCGAFNANAVKGAMAFIKENYDDKAVDLMCVGRKAADIAKKYPYSIVRKETDIFDDLTFEAASEMANQLIAEFESGKYDAVRVVYNSYRNAASQEVLAETFLPLEIKADELQDSKDYIFEPEKKEIGKELVPKMLKIMFFKALLDSNAAEHGARMTAMHQATDNATDLLHELTLQYNKARQSSITNEIMEIVSGAEALSS
ncbi:MAG: ATP synthase F1 subunit gamma [Bacteroidales bacterium]|jgi:F-type H+-transporting ATPase subunit gamma|nr:ATP synthase F1 subunit gamma [Bacteroidales bacterium]